MDIKKSPLTLFFVIFYIGVLFGLTLTAIAAWGDLEAASYGFDRIGGERLNTLYCPILMTANETSSFSVKVTNTTKGKLFPSIKTDISSRLAPISSSFTHIELAPGEFKQPEWIIGPENLDLKQFILARALVYGTYPLPNRENTCGVFVLPVRGNGTWILIVATIISVLCMGSGAWLLYKKDLPAKQIRPILFLLTVILLTLVTSFLGLWIPSIFLLAVTLLMLFSILSFQMRKNM